MYCIHIYCDDIHLLYNSWNSCQMSTAPWLTVKKRKVNKNISVCFKFVSGKEGGYANIRP